MKILIAAVLLLAFMVTVVAAQAVPTDEGGPGAIASAAPPEPNKDLNRKIWEGFYRAELNHRYHLKQASDTSTTGGRINLGVVILGIIAWAIPFCTLLRQHAIAVAEKTKQERLEKLAEASRGWGFWLVNGLSIGALVASIVVSSLGHAGRSGKHMAVAAEWEQLAQEWNDLMDARGKLPEGELDKRYHALIQEQGEISRRETPDLYNEGVLRQVQNDLNKFLQTES